MTRVASTMIRAVAVIALLLLLGPLGGQQTKQPANPTANKQDTATKKAPAKDDMLGARLAYVRLLDTVFKKRGLIIAVKVEGDNRDILDMDSILIGEGTNTLSAAEEVLTAPESVAILKKARFTKVIITGVGYRREYLVKDLPEPR